MTAGYPETPAMKLAVNRAPCADGFYRCVAASSQWGGPVADPTGTARMTGKRRLRLGLPGRRPAETNGAARNAPAAPGEQTAITPAALELGVATVA
jgi:hypothetical protein